MCNKKLLNFIDAFNCYKQKCKLAPFNLAHPAARAYLHGKRCCLKRVEQLFDVFSNMLQ